MTDAIATAATTGAPIAGTARGADDDGLTPAGLQPRALLARRRAVVIGLNLALMGLLTAGIVA
ncbi:MAG: hypothetical protein AAFZ09_11075, partial [Pseudomonadota bacterium]